MNECLMTPQHKKVAFNMLWNPALAYILTSVWVQNQIPDEGLGLICWISGIYRLNEWMENDITA